MEQTHRTSHAKDGDQGWSPQNLIVVVPLVATSFAFAFVVGYFSAFDIGWFPFFSLQEHTVFAIRALPVAVGASVLFLIALIRPIYKRWHLPLTIIWIMVLIAAAILTVVESHLAFAMTFLLVAYGAFVHHCEPAPRKNVEQIEIKDILYWAITLMAMSLIVGWVSATSWKKEWEINKRLSLRLPLPPSMCLQSKSDPTPRAGHVVFVGAQDVLFYDYRTKRTRLLKRDDVQVLFQPQYHLGDVFDRFIGALRPTSIPAHEAICTSDADTSRSGAG